MCRILNDFDKKTPKMGRYYYNKKTTVEQTNQLSIFKLKEFGLLRKYSCYYGESTLTWTSKLTGEQDSIGITVNIENEPCVRLNYTTTNRYADDKTYFDYIVNLTTTPCNLGGIRYWFICPLGKNGSHCGRRVAKLYKPPGPTYFGCRHCYSLTYESRNEPRLARFGGIGYPIKAERQYEDLYKQIKRWTYKGKATKKVRKLHALEERLNDGYAASMRLMRGEHYNQPGIEIIDPL